MFRWKSAAAVGAAAAMLALSGCSGSASEGTGAEQGTGTLTLGVNKQPTTFEAANMQWANETPYAQAVYDSLLRADPDGTIKPHLATEWTYDDSKTKLTLTLRDDVKFTDGTAFNAAVAVQNLHRFRDGTSANAAQLAGVNAVAIDDTHVELTLKAPDPSILTYLSQNAGLQESPSAFAKSDVKTNPVGSGPYVLDSAGTVAGSTYVFTKNPDYWQPSDQHYAKVVMNVFANGSSLLNAIQGGQVNAATTFDNSSLDQIQAAGFDTHPLELNWAGLLLLDRNGSMTKELGDIRVRKAINHAFDREALLKTIGNGHGTVTEQIFPKSSPAFDPNLDSTYAYDPAKAKSLLAEAGYANGFSFSMPRYTSLDPAIYSLLQQQLADVGIQVTYTDLTGSTYLADIFAGKYSAAYIQLQQDTTAWALARYTFTPEAQWNPFHSTTEDTESLLTTIQTGDSKAAEDAAKSLNKYLVEQAWFAPWYRSELNFVSDANTEVTVQSGNAYPYLWNIVPKS